MLKDGGHLQPEDRPYLDRRKAIPKGDGSRWRHDRRKLAHQKLLAKLKSRIAAAGGLKHVGEGRAVLALARELGFEPHSLAVADVLSVRGIVDYICVPNEIWHSDAGKTRLHRLESRMTEMGLSFALFPQRLLP